MTQSAADVTFLQFQKPGVHAGPVIEITATLYVPVQDAGKTEVKRRLFVKGDRLSLSAGTVDSVYPPNNSQGDYSGTLPHIVLTHPTLPWQRLLGVDDTSDAPWLALFLLSELDLAPDGKTPAWNAYNTTLGNLKDPGDAAILSPFASAPHERGEANADPCIALDIACPLFAAVAPRADDAVYLAHVRALSGLHKPTPQPEGQLQYSVVIGNRLPPPGHSCQVFLVSLEHTAAYLPARDGTLPFGQRYTTIRLPVLHRWRFFAAKEKRTFGEVVGKLDQKPSTLRLPPASNSTGADAETIENALAMGFVPAVHDLRLGGKTVSWYRGPLVPYHTERGLEVPLSCSDAACRYDPATGMMDTSAAAAWQLGRLLALNSGSFAAQLYTWKRVNLRDTIDAAEHEFLNLKPLGSTGGSGAARRVAAENAVTLALGHALAVFGGIKGGVAALPLILAAVPVPAPVPAPRAPIDRLKHLKQTMFDSNEIRRLHHHLRLTLRTDDDDDTALPAEVRDWFGKLSLLYGVPFHYLVPDERMLPLESIRFFQVDRSWIAALIDGAFSLGRTTAAEHAHDKAFAEDVTRSAARAAALHRRALVGGEPALPQVRSGFLLRSQAVEHWPGIEVEGFEADDTKAEMLRLEKLTDTILLCLFDRVVTKVKVHQPPEGVHFGFKQVDQEFTKPLRRVQADGSNPVGSETGIVLPKPLLRDAEHHVLDVVGLAERFKKQLSMSADSFTAAEFALEMVTGVHRVIFQVPKP